MQPLADTPMLYASNRDAVVTTVLYTPPIEFDNPPPVVTQTSETTTQGAPQTVDAGGGTGTTVNGANNSAAVGGTRGNGTNGTGGTAGINGTRVAGASGNLPKTFDDMPLGLWLVLLGDQRPHRLRYLPRLAIFCVLAAVAGGLCLLDFFLTHTDWAKLWLIVAGLVAAGLVVLSVLGELYYKTTGKKYTELLERYKAGVNK